jgi:hypothetical protein
MRQARQFVQDTWLPLLIATALVFAVAIAVPWYYREFRGVDPERGMTAEEVSWAGRYAPWRTEIRDGVAAAYEVRTDLQGTLGARLEAVSGCTTELESRVGPAPERLRPAEREARAACERVAGARGFYLDEGGPNSGTTTLLTAALDALREAELEVRRLMLAEGELPRLDERSDESRIDERLGFVATLPHLYVEVRCWTADDWATVRHELATVGLEGLTARAAHANAYRYTAHLGPDTCAPLAAVAYGTEEAARASDERLAGALVAMLHAAEHLDGETDEQEIDCTALARVEEAARELGVAPERAARLAELTRPPAARCPGGPPEDDW